MRDVLLLQTRCSPFFFLFNSRSLRATDLLRAGRNSLLVRDHSDGPLLSDQGLTSAAQLHFSFALFFFSFLFLFTLFQLSEQAPGKISLSSLSVTFYDRGNTFRCKFVI